MIITTHFILVLGSSRQHATRGTLIINYMCVCVTDHRSVRYIRIMRCWCSNLRQRPLWNLGSGAYFDQDYFWTHLTPSSFRPIYFRGGSPLLPRLSIHWLLPCCRTGLSAHPGITHLRPSITRTPRSPPHPSFSEYDSYSPPLSPPHLTDSHLCRTLATADM